MVWGEEVVKVWNGKFYRHEPTGALSGANPGSEKHLGQGTAVTWVRTVPLTSQVTTNTKVRAAARRQSSPTVAALWNYSGQYQLEEAEPPGATSQSPRERHTVLAAVSAEAEGCLLSHWQEPSCHLWPSVPTGNFSRKCKSSQDSAGASEALLDHCSCPPVAGEKPGPQYSSISSTVCIFGPTKSRMPQYLTF